MLTTKVTPGINRDTAEVWADLLPISSTPGRSSPALLSSWPGVTLGIYNLPVHPSVRAPRLPHTPQRPCKGKTTTVRCSTAS